MNIAKEDIQKALNIIENAPTKRTIIDYKTKYRVGDIVTYTNIYSCKTYRGVVVATYLVNEHKDPKEIGNVIYVIQFDPLCKADYVEEDRIIGKE